MKTQKLNARSTDTQQQSNEAQGLSETQNINKDSLSNSLRSLPDDNLELLHHKDENDWEQEKEQLESL